MADEMVVFTIGHSTLSYERFLELLRQHSINAVADVRSMPFSKHFPQFNRDALHAELKSDKIHYVFLGDELGGRPKSRNLYLNTTADYEKMAMTDSFRSGIERVASGAQKYRLSLMCSEHDPLDCHRCLLVGRALKGRSMHVHHILSSGDIVDQDEIERKLLVMSKNDKADLFASESDLVSAAYRYQSMRVAYAESKPGARFEAAE
ncbi:MAG: hypothetical protein RIR97_387 [Pseudomonadota bacterium]